MNEYEFLCPYCSTELSARPGANIACPACSGRFNVTPAERQLVNRTVDFDGIPPTAVARSSAAIEERPTDQEPASSHAQPTTDPLEQLRKLGDLRAAGVLTDEEFETKKAQLLDRI